jgi:hypothetical protein
MQHAKILYKRSEQLNVDYIRGEWWVSMPVESYLRKSKTDYSLKLGSQHFKIVIHHEESVPIST